MKQVRRDIPLPTVSDAEFDTMIAALRFWQSAINRAASPEFEIASDAGNALGDAEIDGLCEHLYSS